MNAHVDEGTEPSEVANYVVNLLDKKKLESTLLFRKIRTKDRSAFEMDTATEFL